MTEATRKRREAKRKNRERRLRRYRENDKNFTYDSLVRGLYRTLAKIMREAEE